MGPYFKIDMQVSMDRQIGPHFQIEMQVSMNRQMDPYFKIGILKLNQGFLIPMFSGSWIPASQ